MRDYIQISDLLSYLDEQRYDYEFVGDKDNEIEGYSTVFNYKKNTITFISTLNNFRDYKQKFKKRQIQLILSGFEEKGIDCAFNMIKTEYPKKMFFDLLNKFYGNPSESKNIIEYNHENNISFISDKAQIGENVKIGHGCVIEDDVIIKDNSTIHHNVVIRSNTKIGYNCTIYSGTVIGERGFNPYTLEDGTREMLVHYGGVTIKDNVHIGENCCVARGSLEDTVIESGVKFNTMVHVAHNVHIEENTAITMPTHISGSVRIGRNCHIAATTIRNQCTIGDRAILGLGSVVVKDVEAGETVVGNPAKPLEKKDR